MQPASLAVASACLVSVVPAAAQVGATPATKSPTRECPPTVAKPREQTGAALIATPGDALLAPEGRAGGVNAELWRSGGWGAWARWPS